MTLAELKTKRMALSLDGTVLMTFRCSGRSYVAKRMPQAMWVSWWNWSRGGACLLMDPRSFLDASGVAPGVVAGGLVDAPADAAYPITLSPAAVGADAKAFTVMVECWK